MGTPTIPQGAVVVGVDGSQASGHAVAWAAEVSATESRPLVLAHAVHLASPWLYGEGVDVPALNHDITRAGEELIDRTKSRLENEDIGLTVSVVCEPGDARDLLIDLSRRAHLVVVGARGQGRLRSLLLGSVSSAVARKSSCPVAVVREAAEPPAVRGVVVGGDGSERSLPVLDLAFRAASWRRQRLTVVHCFWEAIVADGFALAAPLHSDYEAERLAMSESLAGLRDTYPDVEVAVEFERGLPEDVLADLTRDASLVVVGSHEHGALSELILGSVSTALLERADCPVIVVPSR